MRYFTEEHSMNLNQGQRPPMLKQSFSCALCSPRTTLLRSGDGETPDGRRDQHEPEQLQDQREMDHPAGLAQPAGQLVQDEVSQDVGEVHDLRHHPTWGCPSGVHPQSVSASGDFEREIILTKCRQNIDLPETTFERIEALIYLVAEEQKFEEQLKKVLPEYCFQLTNNLPRSGTSPSWPVLSSSM